MIRRTAVPLKSTNVDYFLDGDHEVISVMNQRRISSPNLLLTKHTKTRGHSGIFIAKTDRVKSAPGGIGKFDYGGISFRLLKNTWRKV